MIQFKYSFCFLALFMFGAALPVMAGPLHKAAKSGDIEEVKQLIAKGKNVNEKKQFSKKTPLMYAVEYNRTNITKLLLTKGAEINDADTLGDTALLKAAENTNLDIMKLLLKNGADVNATNNNGDTPLLNATKKGHIGAVELILSYDPIITVKNADGETALNSATSRGFKNIEKLLNSSAEKK